MVALTSLGWSVPPPFDYAKATVKTLETHGPSGQKFDLVFIADGYTTLQYQDFMQDVKSACDYLWQTSFYGEYRSYFNIHSCFVPAIQVASGIQFPFGSAQLNAEVGSLYVTRMAELEQVSQKAPGCDLIIVLSTLSGTSNGGSPIVIASRDYAALGHEMGHNLGGLGDEYNSDTRQADRDLHPLPLRSDFAQVNLTLPAFVDLSSPKKLAETVKWKHLLALPDGPAVVGAVPGGYYRADGVYRPSFRCIMRNHRDVLFCPVCHEEMVKKLMQFCNIPFNHEEYHRLHPLRSWK